MTQGTTNLTKADKMAAGRKLAVFIIGIVTLINAGCGAPPAEEDPRLSSPRQTYKHWVEASVRGDISTSTIFITEDSKKFLDLQTNRSSYFADQMAVNAKKYKEQYEIEEEKIIEERALIVLKGLEGKKILIPLKKDARGWKIDLMAMFRM